MLRNWENRSQEVAALFNPAFTSLLICNSIKEFKKNGECKAPYAFPFILLPIVLHPHTRIKLPRSAKTAFSTWILKKENATIKSGFAGRAKNMVPYVKESLLFALKNNKLSITNDGMIILCEEIKIPTQTLTQEINDCIRASTLCGKWFSKISDLKTVMTLLGIQP